MGATGSSARDERRDWDQFSKVAVEAGLAGVLARVGLAVSADDLTAVPVDLPGGTRRVDELFRGPDGLFVHVEIQQRPHPEMGPRMIEYLGRIAANPPFAGQVREIRQIVIQLSGPPMPTHHDFGDAVLDFRLLHCPTTPLAVFLQTPALAPFGLTSRDPRALEPVVEAIASVADLDLKASLANLAAFLAPGLRVKLFELMRRTTLIDTHAEMLAEMRDTWLGRDLLTEGDAIGHQRGHREGHREGVVEALTVRFPDADPVRIERTADRLVAADEHPVRAALALASLDD